MAVLIECVPNFSEGRVQSRVDAIVDAMKRDGVYLLDYTMDADHNRSVVTLVGEPAPLLAAVLDGIGRAAELIDLNRQRGVHPRMGATDVVPFIPIEGTTLEDCVQLAHELGQRVWERYQIPVYFYEAAAVRRERTNLENIRRGQFETIREEIAILESRRPDVGAPRCHPTAGAVAIGARKFLVAYNIYLQTKDIQVAKTIAKAVRFSSGGFRAVKAIGLEVRGQAQVSMNLTDTDLTPIATVFEFVKREAARHGVLTQSSEIVGLVPKRALEDAAAWFLQVENFDSTIILENRLAEVMAGESAAGGARAGVEPFLEHLAAPTSVPGGGSAAAAAGAMAAALAAKAAGSARGKKSHEDYDAELGVALQKLGLLGEELRDAINEEAASAHAVAAAREAQKNATDARAAGEAMAAALRSAAAVPLRVAQCSAEVSDVAMELRDRTDPGMRSDLTVALAMAKAAMEGSLANVEMYLNSLEAECEAIFIAETRAAVWGLRNLPGRPWAGRRERLG